MIASMTTTAGQPGVVPWVIAAPHPNGLQVFCQVCRAKEIVCCPEAANAFAIGHRQHRTTAGPSHVGLGDAVAAVAKRLGFKKPCQECEQRRVRLNRKVPRLFSRR